MNPPGDAETLVAARSALLDALEALADQREALVLIGAQAVYLHTGAASVALGEATKDTDLAVDPRALNDDPLLEEAMQRAGFHRNLTDPQPGSWLSPRGVPVDLMVPAALAGEGGRRGGRIPPHSRHATRRTPGLEAAVVDHARMTITALDPNDTRSAEMEVAGPAALLVAKLHKLGERRDTPGRLLDKDAHDIYRLLVATETVTLATAFAKLQGDELAGSVTDEAILHLEELFASGPDALGSTMAGRAEELFGNADVVSAAVATLAADLVAVLQRG
jgi:Nucleotidyltransferase